MSDPVRAAIVRLVVVGCHRSGTSALTGALAAAGAVVGAEADLMRAGPENRRGFLERRDVRRICDEALEARGATWWTPPLDRGRTVRVDVGSRSFRAVLDGLDRTALAAGRDVASWVLKEPRLTVLLDDLLGEDDRDPLVVMALRHPLEVAASLRDRNGLPLMHGLAVWEAYVRAGLELVRRRDGVVVPYEDVLAGLPSVLARVQAAVVARWGIEPGWDDPPEGTIDPALHHQRDRRLVGLVSSVQWRLWEDAREGRAAGAAALGPETRELLRELAGAAAIASPAQCIVSRRRQAELRAAERLVRRRIVRPAVRLARLFDRVPWHRGSRRGRS